jgi:hypothetical protein
MIPDVTTMSIDDKMLTMSELWKDLRGGIDLSPETEQIKAILQDRLSQVEAGKAELLDWDEVKGSIGRR